jgi:phosphohistidine swiveling domain-containing protein
MIKSLVDIDVFDQESASAFYTSLSTVGGQLATAMRSEKIDDVLKKYGHLRPGTYEITNLRYDEAPELYFKKLQNNISPPKTSNFEFSKDTKREVSSLLRKFGLDATFASFINFAQSAIELREYAKFCFTKNVSDALSLIAELGESLGISREDMSYCNIGTIFDLYVSPGGMKEKILQSINSGKAQFKISSAVALPPLITRASDVWSFHYPRVKPNFVGSGQVTALVEKIPTTNSLQGKIVLIENADPGYDWLFTHDIAGLITAWGGANSHMAIRCAELGIPAVIGIGQNEYDQYCSVSRVLLDCSSHLIEILP